MVTDTIASLLRPRDNAMRKRNSASLEAELKALESLDTPALRSRWSEEYDSPAPGRISRELLMRAVAYRIQEKEYGGLSKATQRKLLQIAKQVRETGSAKNAGPSFKPGTKLIREWNGKVHEVTLCEDGYLWSGRRFQSLSSIARAITGTRWSGPRFFGLEAGQTARGAGE
jgi:hypothetical protein